MAGWAGALGAAITGGVQGYQQGQQEQRSKEAFIAQQKIQALQQAILNDQVNELPKRHAEEDLDRFMKINGDNSYNMPEYPGMAKAAGVPTQIASVSPRRQRMQGVEQGEPWGLPQNTAADFKTLPNTDTISSESGVAPDTGVVMNPDVALRTSERALAITRSKAINKFLGGGGSINDGQPQWSPSGGGQSGMSAGVSTADDGVGPEPPLYDPQQLAEFQRAKLTGMPEPPLIESAQHKLWLQAKELANKNAHPAIGQQAQREIESFQKVKALVPKIRAALMRVVRDPNDPTGQAALGSLGGWVGLAGQRIKSGFKAAAYDAGFPLDADTATVEQLGGLMKVVAAMPFMNGSRSQQMFQVAAEHMLDRRGTPESMLQRLDHIEDVYPEMEQALLKYYGQAGNPNVGGMNSPPAAASGAAPAAAPAAPPAREAAPGSGPSTASLQAEPGKTFPYTEVVRRATLAKQDPKVFAARLKQAGVIVVGEPAQTPQAPQAKPGSLGLQGVTSLRAVPPPANWTMDSFLHNIGVR